MRSVLSPVKSFIISLLILCSGHFSVTGQTLRVAVAANAQFVADSLKEVYLKNHPVKIDLIVGSSGKLTAQATNGAPYDLFLSADMTYPENIFKSGAALTKNREYAAGKLVVWTLKKNGVSNLNNLQSSRIQTIAVANPKLAPYGIATITALKKLGLYEAVKSKIVYAESISQVNQYLLTGAADIAFTAKSIVRSPEYRHKGYWTEVPASLYQPIEQGVILLKHAKQSNFKAAQEFYRFLFSPAAKAVFEYFGYQVR